MKKFSSPFRFVLFAGLAVGLVAQPFARLHADDHGGGGGGSDDGGGTGGQHGGGDGGHEVEDHGKTEFLGTIQALPGTTDLTGQWTVDGRTVSVDAATLIRTEHGTPVVGGKVEVEGAVLADGSILANVVKTEDTGLEREDNVFFGTVQALPATGVIGTWQVSGLTVLVDGATRVDTERGNPVIGSLVRVEGVQQADASIVASEIEIQSAAVASAQAASKKVKLTGVIQQLPATLGAKGNWVIDGVVVTVTDDSVRVPGGRKAKAGRQVVIKGFPQLNGSILARRVDVPRVSH